MGGRRQALWASVAAVTAIAGTWMLPTAPVAAVPTTSTPFAGPYERVSTSGSGVQGNGGSAYAAMTGDGSTVAFTSEASNLVAGDTNGEIDLFVRTRSTGAVERLNLGPSGVQADAGPGRYYDEAPAISDDGNLVAFSSRATNLVPGDTNGASDVFVRDRAAGTTTRISVTPEGTQLAGASSGPAISADGRYVTFISDAPHGEAPSDLSSDVYRKDLGTGALELASTHGAGSVATARISADGRWVAYGTGGRALRRDMAGADLVDVATSVGGGQPTGTAWVGGISADGSRVVFASTGTDLVDGDDDGYRDAFVTDLATQTSSRISDADDQNRQVWASDLSRDGQVAAFEQMNRPMSVVDLAEDHTTLVASGNNARLPRLSADGRVLTFAANLGGLVPGDTNGVEDVFLAELGPADVTPPTIACGPADGAWQGNDASTTCTAEDVGSGLASPEDASFTLTTSVSEGQEDGDASTGTREVCDAAGNCATAGPVTGFRVDRAAPTITVSSPADGAVLVRGAAVAAAYGCSDGGSGVATCAGDPADGAPLPTAVAGPAVLEVTATDAVGNTADVDRAYTVTDTVLSGQVTSSGDEAPLDGATVSLWADGDEDATATASTGPDGRYSLSVDDVDAGTYRIRVAATDHTPTWHAGAASREAATPVALGTAPSVVDVALDPTDPVVDDAPPTVTCDAPDPGTTHAEDVTVSCTATDDGSGLTGPGDAAFTLTTQVAEGTEDPSAQTTSREVCDVAGSCTTAGPYGPYAVDRDAPRITITTPQDGGLYPADGVPPALFQCDDLTLASCTGSTAFGQPLPSTGGTHSLQVTATDDVGRTRTLTHTYTVDAVTLTGRVRAKATGAPLSGVLVEAWPAWVPETEPAAATATTGSDGTYTLDGLWPGAPYHLRWSKAGHQTVWNAGFLTREAAPPLSWGAGTISLPDVQLAAEDGPPTIQCDPLPPSPYWSRFDITVHCAATDATGLANPSQAHLYLSTSVGPGGESATAMTNSVSVCDVGGRCATAGPLGPFKIDRKAPTWTCSLSSPPPSTSGWHRVGANHTCSAADGGVGGMPPTFGLSTSVPAGTASANASTNTRQLCDALDNCTGAVITGLKVDNALPTLTGCSAPPSGWVATNVTLTCTLSDVGAGLDGPSSRPFATTVAMGVETANAAATPASGPPWVCDLAGNCPMVSVSGIRIDRKGPVITCNPPDGVWHSVNITRSCLQTDGGSGIPPTVIPFPGWPFPISNPPTFSASTNVAAGAYDANARATASSKCDNVGNCSSVSVSGNKIDRTTPTASITTPRDGATYLTGSAVTASFTCADTGSGVASCDAPVGDGAALPTGTPGTHTFTVTVTDGAGNTSTATRTYTVVDALSGVVTDESTGLPLAGARVSVFDVGSPTPLSLVTDADGRYRVPQLAPGQYQVKVVKAGYLDTWNGQAARRNEAAVLTVGAGDPLRVDVVLARPSTASGLVTSAVTGAPEAGVTVSVYRDGSTAALGTTDTGVDGRWTFPRLSAGTYQISYGSSRHTTVWQGGSETRAASTDTVLVAGETVDLTAEVRPLVTLSGSVTDAGSRAPIAKATVLVYAEGEASRTYRASTAPDGSFTIPVAPGRYEVRFTKGGYLTRWFGGSATRSGGTVVVADAAPLDLSTTLPAPAAISGTVTSSSSGAPLAGVVVRVYAPGSAEIVQGTRTAADGSWSMEGLPSGPYEVYYRADGHDVTWHDGAATREASTPVVLAPGSAAEITASLRLSP